MRAEGAGASDRPAVVRKAVELLARGPEDYPAGAVEWLIAAGK
jgi:hypothetical protein